MTPSQQDRFAILILHGTTAHDFQTPFNMEIARAVTSFGCDPVFIDLREERLTIAHLEEALRKYTKDRILFAFTFHGYGTSIGEDTPSGNIWEKLQIPVLSIMADHPCYNIRRHKHPSPAIMQIYSSRDFFDFNTAYIKAPYRKAFVEWGAFTHGQTPKPRDLKPGEAPRIIFPKSGHNPFELDEMWKILPPLMQKIIHDALDDYWDQSKGAGSVVPSVLKAAKAQGIALEDDMSLFSFFVAQLDDYTRRVKTTAVIKDLMTMPIHIYADNLSYLDTSKAKAKILPPIPNDQLVTLYQDATAVVSLNPNVHDSVQDRVFSAFGAGALPITDGNQWIADNCPALTPYCYDFKNTSAAHIVQKVLDAPLEAAELGWKIGEEQRTKRTFENAIHDAIQHGLMHRFFTFNYVPPQRFYIKPSL